MALTLGVVAVTVAVLLGMAACLEIGRWLARRRTGDEGRDEAGTGAVDAAIFGLLGLMIGFTFSGAANRFDQRRGQSVMEANAIGSAYLRLDLLPREAQPRLRQLFREYLGSRIAIYQNVEDEQRVRAAYDRGLALQDEIWTRAVAAAQSAENPAVLILVVPSLNEMIDVTASRLAAARTHVPWIMVAELLALAFAAALLVGYSTAGTRRSWLRAALFTVVVVAAIHMALDLEYPRAGLIRIGPTDQALSDLLQQMR